MTKFPVRVCEVKNSVKISLFKQYVGIAKKPILYYQGSNTFINNTICSNTFIRHCNRKKEWVPFPLISNLGIGAKTQRTIWKLWIEKAKNILLEIDQVLKIIQDLAINNAPGHNDILKCMLKFVILLF